MIGSAGAPGGRLRIAMYTDCFHPELSGIADSISTVAEALAARGHRVRVFAPRYAVRDYRITGRAPDDGDAREGAEITRLPSVPYPTGTGQGRIALPDPASRRAQRDFGPDLVHVHLPFVLGREGARAARRHGVPLVGTNHTPLGEYARYGPVRGAWAQRAADRWSNRFYRRCDFVSAPARAILDAMGDALAGVPSAVVPNPVRLGSFRPLPGRGELKRGFGFAPFTVLYVGRLAPEKGVARVIRAVARLCRDAPDAGLALAGIGPSRAELEGLCRALGVERRVRFLGFVADPQALARVYNASDAFLIAGEVDTQCIAAMQAMACGVPVVATRAWGIEEYVGRENGVLVDPGDEDALYRALVELHADPAARARLGEGGRETVRALSGSLVARRWEAIYLRLTRAARRRGPRGVVAPARAEGRREGELIG